MGNAKIQEATVKAEADEAVNEREKLTATLSIMKELMEDASLSSDMRDRAICEIEELYKEFLNLI